MHVTVVHLAIPIFTNGTIVSVKVRWTWKTLPEAAALSQQAWTKKVVLHFLLVVTCCTFLQIIAEHVNIGKGTDPLVIE